MGAGPLSDAELIRRTRICLFEVGYHDVRIEVIGRTFDGYGILGTTASIEPAVGYQVGMLLCTTEGRPMTCWACWLDDAGEDCRQGNCHHPEGPARPPREKLVGA